MQFVLIYLSVLLRVAVAVRITGLDIPNVAVRGEEIRLRCDYDENHGSRLYSFKWYKDGKEFYRHVPGTAHTSGRRCSDNVTPHSLGITIDCMRSSEKEVVLKNVSQTTSGEYRCEVIGDLPGFRREHRTAQLTVYNERLKSPIVDGMMEHYELGDIVSLNCTSQNTEYNPSINWLVNGIPANNLEVIKSRVENQQVSELRFLATEPRFQNGILEVQCRLSLGSNHIQIAKETLSLTGIYLRQYYNAGTKLITSVLSQVLPPLVILLW